MRRVGGERATALRTKLAARSGTIFAGTARKTTSGGARGRAVTTARKVTLRTGRTGPAPARRGTIQVAGRGTLRRRSENVTGTQKAFMRTGNQRTAYSMRTTRRGVAVKARQG